MFTKSYLVDHLCLLLLVDLNHRGDLGIRLDQEDLEILEPPENLKVPKEILLTESTCRIKRGHVCFSQKETLVDVFNVIPKFPYSYRKLIWG